MGVFGGCRNFTEGCKDLCPDLKQLYPTEVNTCKVCSNGKISILVQAISIATLPASVEMHMI